METKNQNRQQDTYYFYEYESQKVQEEHNKIHQKYLTDAIAKGDADGKRNLPAINQITMSSFEQNIQSAYQSEIFNLYGRGTQILNDCKHRHFLPAKKEYTECTPKYLNQLILEKESERDNKLGELNDIHLDKGKDIHNDLQLESAKREFKPAEKRFDDVCNKLGRKELQIQIKNKTVYYTLLSLIGLVESAFCYQSFKLFRESPLLTVLLALAPILTIPLAAHKIGIFIKQRKEQKINIIFAIVLFLIVTGVNYWSAKTRTVLLLKKDPSADQYFWFFFLLSMGLFVLAIIISYFRHDESHEFVEVTKIYEEKKNILDAEEKRVNTKVQAEKENFIQAKEKIQNEFNAQKLQIKELPKTLLAKRNEAVYKYNALLGYFQGLELRVNEEFKTAINEYRNQNYKVRERQEVPVYWGQPIPDLKFKFQNEKEIKV